MNRSVDLTRTHETRKFAGVIADIIRRLRALERSSQLEYASLTGTDGSDIDLAVAATNAMRIPEKDAFTVASAATRDYRLSFLPVPKSVNLSINGAELDEGSDYTVDSSTGDITLAATVTTVAGSDPDVLTADYWTNGATSPVGPWVQPADLNITSVAPQRGQTTKVYFSSTADGGTMHGAFYADTSDGVTVEDPTSESSGVGQPAGVFVDGGWHGSEAVMVWDAITAAGSPVPPSAEELAQPGVIGFEYEKPDGDAVVLEWNAWRDSAGSTPNAFTNAITIGVRELDASQWSLDSHFLPDFTWQTPPQLLAMPARLSIPIVGDSGRSTSPLATYADGTARTELALIVVVNQQADETIDDLSMAAFGDTGFILSSSVSVTLTVAYRPPRYRLIYGTT